MADFDRESMLEMFTYEMSQLLEQLEQNIIQGESGYSLAEINEIFRIMHTIKGSAAMMLFDSISTTAHSIEDLFFYLREENPQGLNYTKLTDLVLEGMDFIKNELGKIESGAVADGDGTDIIKRMKSFLCEIKGQPETPAEAEKTAPEPAKTIAVPEVSGSVASADTGSGGEHKYKAKIYFEDGCEMENIRAYTLVHNLGDKINNVSHTPEDIIDEEAIPVIRKNGFLLEFSSNINYDEINTILSSTVYLRELELEELTSATPDLPASPANSEDLLRYEALITFEADAEMDNVRAYAVVHNVEKVFSNLEYEPKDLVSEASNDIIKANGFKLSFDTSLNYDDTYKALSNVSYLNSLELKLMTKEELKPDEQQSVEITPVQETAPVKSASAPPPDTSSQPLPASKKTPTQHVISVSVNKLDQLLNLMGELVIAEAMVTQNPELEGLELESFHKETRQLRKIINDVQDNVMSMRMVPLSTTFFKMHRIVRDMCKQLNKDVQLEISGEDTEVDKNIIEHISDPLMHIIRNSVDHGIETPEVRRKAGKPEKGTVYLEAKNSGGDVLIIVRDDGAGLNRDKILEKAKNNGLLRKPENEYTDKEIHQFIFLPGFSTNDSVTSYSGRGVGMDVVITNLELVGGSAIVESNPGEGSIFTLKIPLTLAIIEGMTIKMGGAKYTIPIISIQQSFKAKKENVFTDPSGNEMITVRGEVYNVVRLYEFFGIESKTTDIEEGIMIMLENGDQTVCLFADELIGEQQVVVKTMPKYIKKIRGISGCTLLGNGDISLIIDVAGFFD